MIRFVRSSAKVPPAVVSLVRNPAASPVAGRARAARMAPVCQFHVQVVILVAASPALALATTSVDLRAVHRDKRVQTGHALLLVLQERPCAAPPAVLRGRPVKTGLVQVRVAQD